MQLLGPISLRYCIIADITIYYKTSDMAKQPLIGQQRHPTYIRINTMKASINKKYILNLGVENLRGGVV